ncbi:NrfD/PsrC family molybdoenzyme membrane anchor subunit [Desulfosporosinus shakirovi]|uniref:NrfD/PsrC family molybdoenzyme membrane anchor subunit n=1 Tax=Desulfosporosinus shakirovi TaxID=2885154 RepID=UPI001E4ADC71|nr:NrfD/PsrC family molybdoenzyme membrane anchor subunit [Desulfosporosinus sp. SRJS8]MCB8814812.1 polysulfide reductase NrfD [Desulfosporosinus sp. SRJS8]
MAQKHETWGWMLAVDFFFAGMGGGMLVIAGLSDLFLGVGMTSVLGNLLGPCFVGLGACLLVLELGRPFQSWRVFMNPKAILTFGAWNMLFAIGSGFIYTSFGIGALPWSNSIPVREFFAVTNVIFGMIVATYPGVLLARHKSRPFWTGTGIMGLFLISSLVTGGAAHMISQYVYGAISSIVSSWGIVDASSSAVLRGLPFFVAGLLALQLILWIGYVWIKHSGSTKRETIAAERWISGNYAMPFKGGFLLLGTFLPLVLVLIPGDLMKGLGALLVILGGLIMRLLVVYSGQDRTWLPGEQKYRSRLPLGHEAFLKAWNSK